MIETGNHFLNELLRDYGIAHYDLKLKKSDYSFATMQKEYPTVTLRKQ